MGENFMRYLLLILILTPFISPTVHADLDACLRHISNEGGKIAGDLSSDGSNYVISGWDNATKKISEAERRNGNPSDTEKLWKSEWKTTVYTPSGKVVVGPGTECVSSKEENVFTILARRLKYNQVYDPKSPHYRGKSNTKFLLFRCADIKNPEVQGELDRIAKANGLKVEGGAIKDLPATSQ